MKCRRYFYDGKGAFLDLFKWYLIGFTMPTCEAHSGWAPEPKLYISKNSAKVFPVFIFGLWENWASKKLTHREINALPSCQRHLCTSRTGTSLEMQTLDFKREVSISRQWYYTSSTAPSGPASEGSNLGLRRPGFPLCNYVSLNGSASSLPLVSSCVLEGVEILGLGVPSHSAPGWCS